MLKYLIYKGEEVIMTIKTLLTVNYSGFCHSGYIFLKNNFSYQYETNEIYITKKCLLYIDNLNLLYKCMKVHFPRLLSTDCFFYH